MIPLALATVLAAANVAQRTHLGQWREIHPLEAGIALDPTVQGGIGIDADTEASLGAVVEERNDTGIHFGQIEQEVPVAHPGQSLLFLDI